MSRFVDPRPKYSDLSGITLVGGKLEFFGTGLSTAPSARKDTFKDDSESDAEKNTNPLPLNGDGTVPNCFYTGAARVRLLDADDAVQWDLDPVVSGGDTGAFSSYSSTKTYAKDNIVVFGDKFYLSKENENQNNQPDTSEEEWEEIEFTRIYNSTTSYAINANVTEDGFEYRSIQANNLNNLPSSSPLFWELAGTNALNNRIINVSNATSSGDAMNLAMATATGLYF